MGKSIHSGDDLDSYFFSFGVNGREKLEWDKIHRSILQNGWHYEIETNKLVDNSQSKVVLYLKYFHNRNSNSSNDIHLVKRVRDKYIHESFNDLTSYLWFLVSL